MKTKSSNSQAVLQRRQALLRTSLVKEFVHFIEFGLGAFFNGFFCFSNFENGPTVPNIGNKKILFSQTVSSPDIAEEGDTVSIYEYIPLESISSIPFTIQ